jgi:hypothetical protein
MPTGQGTKADQDLLRVVAKLGATVTLRQLQTWRRIGLVPQPIIVRRGRLGTESVGYPEGTESVVASVKVMLDRCHKIQMVSLAVFGSGVNLPEKTVRNAYKWLLDRSELDDLRALTLANESHSAYSQFVRKNTLKLADFSEEIQERWMSSARQRAKAESRIPIFDTEETEHVSAQMILERDTEELMESMVSGDGDPSRVLEVMGFSETDLENFEHDGGMPTFAELRRILDDATYEDLVEMRDEALGRWKGIIDEGMPAPMHHLLTQVSVSDPMFFGYMMATSVLSARRFRVRLNQSEEVTNDRKTG